MYYLSYIRIGRIEMLKRLFSKGNNVRYVGDFRIDKWTFRSTGMNMGWYKYKITYIPTNDTFKGDTEHNLSKDDRRAEVMLLNLYRKHMNKNTRINSNSIDKDDNDYW